jgi:tetratricopeptide (TPR) repeat protein
MGFQDDIRAAFRRGDSAAVVRMAQAEIERARARQDPAGEVEARYALARVALRDDDLARAEGLAQQALEVALRSGDRRLEERPRHVLAAVARLSGDHALARDRYLASIELNRALGQPDQVGSEQHNLAFTELHLGNVDRARELFVAGRERAFHHGDRSFAPYLGIAAAALAVAEGDHARAARMTGFTERAFADLGQVPDPDDAADLSAARTAAVTALGETCFAAERTVGAAWTATEAFGLSWPD